MSSEQEARPAGITNALARRMHNTATAIEARHMIRLTDLYELTLVVGREDWRELLRDPDGQRDGLEVRQLESGYYEIKLRGVRVLADPTLTRGQARFRQELVL